MISEIETREWRRRHKLTQEEMAKMVGCSRSVYCNWENGKKKWGLRPVVLAQIAALIAGGSVDKEKEATLDDLQSDLVYVLADELRGLADLLEKNLPSNLKAKRFESLIRYYFENLADYLDALR